MRHFFESFFADKFSASLTNAEGAGFEFFEGTVEMLQDAGDGDVDDIFVRQLTASGG